MELPHSMLREESQEFAEIDELHLRMELYIGNRSSRTHGLHFFSFLGRK